MASVWCEGMNEQVRKYALILSYIALLNKEIARNAALLEAKREMRKSEKTKHENKADRVC